jgi:hypothetical protein
MPGLPYHHLQLLHYSFVHVQVVTRSSPSRPRRQETQAPTPALLQSASPLAAAAAAAAVVFIFFTGGDKKQPKQAKKAGDPGANPRAFAFQSAVKAKAYQARSAEKEQRRLHGEQGFYYFQVECPAYGNRL